MNRLFWGIALLVLVAGGGWSQSTWRGQAEIWTAKDAPAEGFVAASNEFPRNSLLSIENYKTRKTVQVRVIAALPAGSSALVLLNGKAAQALEIKTGEIPLVGVRLDPTGIDRPDNPDPDVNPLAAKPAAATATATAPAPVPAPAAAVPAPVAVAPAAAPVRTPAVTSLDVARGTTALDPDLLPLPALAAPEPVAEPAAREPLPVAAEAEPETPVTPGRKVFVTTRDPEPVALEVPAVTETPAAAPVPVPEPLPDPAPPAVPLESNPAVPAVAEAPAAPVAEAVSEPVPEPVAEPAPVPVSEPAVADVPAAPAAAPAVLAVKPAANAWVPVPGKLVGPVLGAIPLLPGLEKGLSYVQLGAWASEADLLTVLGTVKSYVPLALYRAEGEKNPWRVVAAAPKGQLGVLLMHFRSQGFRTAGMVKG